MMLIAILICLALQKLADIGSARTFTLPLFEKYLGWIKKWLTKLNPWLALVAIVAPFLLILVILHLLTWSRLLGLPYLIIAIVVLFFAMDARDLEKALEPYFAAIRENDIKKAAEKASEFSNEKITKDSSNMYRIVSKTILSKAFNDMLAPLFWFMILGFYGAALYCLVATIKQVALKVDSNYAAIVKTATQAKDILDWLPIRLTALSYALAGHFSIAFSYWYKKILVKPTEQQNFNIDSGLAALDANLDDPTQADSKENNFALQLVNRVLIIWLIALALFVLGKWLT